MQCNCIASPRVVIHKALTNLLALFFDLKIQRMKQWKTWVSPLVVTEAVADAVAPLPSVKANVFGPKAVGNGSDPKSKKSGKGGISGMGRDVGASSSGGVGSAGGVGVSGGGGTGSSSGVGRSLITFLHWAHGTRPEINETKLSQHSRTRWLIAWCLSKNFQRNRFFLERFKLCLHDNVDDALVNKYFL